MTTHLDRLLFAQGGQCFFCLKPLLKAEASVEHLVASANGGTNDDGNCVACCKALNHLLGSKSIKEKMQIVLNQRGNFQCPSNACAQPAPPPGPAPAATAPKAALPPTNGNPSAIDLELADLKKRGASRPRKVATPHTSAWPGLKTKARSRTSPPAPRRTKLRAWSSLHWPSKSQSLRSSTIRYQNLIPWSHRFLMQYPY